MTLQDPDVFIKFKSFHHTLGSDVFQSFRFSCFACLHFFGKTFSLGRGQLLGRCGAFGPTPLHNVPEFYSFISIFFLPFRS